MEKLATWIRKVPFGIWLFLAFTQLVGIFASYNRWQTAIAILSDWREHPSLPRDSIERMAGVARTEYRGVWISVAMVIVFLACAAIKRREKLSSATQS